ncbi:MAG TPA: T9SS type A sorting domain-containing protein, partial [Chitinophagaceae bacterium]|nr:T9SS type A sorting domain-containing protein [Chitinophagaceae bacterium]
SWGSTQTWMFWMGRSTDIGNSNMQAVWLWADGANLGQGAGRDGYLVSFGLQGVNRIQLVKAVNGSPTTLIQTPTISTSISDYGILVRVTRSPTGVWKLYTSTLPTSNNSGPNPSTIPSAANTTVDHNAAGVTDKTYTNFTDGYVGFRIDYADNTSDRDAAQFDNFIFSFASLALPVKLTSFDAAKEGSAVKLQWNTEEESNVANYEIQRSTDGINFSTISNVAASNKKTYGFTDAQPLSDNSYYRLRIVDTDGSVKLSHIVSVKSKAGMTIKLTPNPVRGIMVMQHPKADANSVVQVMSAEGRIVKQVQVPANSVITNVDMTGFRNGTYYVSFSSAGQKYSATIVKQ